MQARLTAFLETHQVTGWRAWTAAIGAIVLATALRAGLNPVFGDTAPYTFQALALLGLSALVPLRAGLLSGLLAVTLGWLFLPPYDATPTEKGAVFVVLLIVATAIVLLTSTLREAILRAEEANRKAEHAMREVRHRVQNLFAVTNALVNLSSRRENDENEALKVLRQRITALSRAHKAALDRVLDDTVDLREMLSWLLAPPDRATVSFPPVRMDGPQLRLPSRCITPLALVMHELAEAARAHCPDPTDADWLRLTWTVSDGTVSLLWREKAPARIARDDGTRAGDLTDDLLYASLQQLDAALHPLTESDRHELRLDIHVPRAP